MEISFSSAVVILVLVLDPIGNIPIFVSLLRRVDAARRTRVILRECAIAFAVLLAFVFVGEAVLRLFDLSEASLTIAGGVILFLIALRMIFHSGAEVFANLPEGEPFIVPLAIPSIAGPAAIATIVLLSSAAPQRWPEWCAAITIATTATLLVLVFAERVVRAVGERALGAFERLFGLFLTAIAIEMLLRGIEAFVRQLAPVG
ncbi:MAG TPA: MarC family protein [Burkholderiales bacterium]|nr:MarC family protein [Burkholderiales bacterium]